MASTIRRAWWYPYPVGVLNKIMHAQRQPNSDRRLRCIVNLDGSAKDYAHATWANKTAVVVDFNVNRGTYPATYEAVYNQVLDTLQVNYPDLWVGQGVSGSFIDTAVTYFPQEAILDSEIPEEYEHTYTDRVNLSDPVAREFLASWVIGRYQSTSRGRSILFIDNIIHPLALENWVPWADSCKLLRSVRTGINRGGGRLWANVAGALNFWADADLPLVVDSVDGFEFEQPYHATIRDDPTETVNLINRYRYFLDRRKAVVMIAVGDTAAAVHMLAGLCMMIRNQGHSLFLAAVHYEAAPVWNDYPEQLGHPMGEYALNVGTLVFTRQFEHGLLTVDVPNETVTIS